MRKVQAFLIALFMVLVCWFPYPAVYAAGESTGMDVVLVLDLSGSMKTTDAGRVSLEGAKLFIDMMESADSRAGFVAFDSKVTEQYNLSTMNSSDDKNNIKNAIDGLQYSSGDTNIGDAVEKAVGMLEVSQDIGNKRMVLFFTDGNIDLDSKPEVESDSEKISLQQTLDASARAASEDITIYTIGLNAGQSEKFRMDPTLITEMADTANGICRVVTSASELPSAFNDIFAKIVDSEIDDLGSITISDPNSFEEKQFEIPNESVLEANIVMITGGTGNLSEIELIDPNGNTLSPDGKKLLFSKSNNYNMLKMIAPQVGDWLLRIRGDQGCEIHLNLIFNYDVTIEATAEEDRSGENALVFARLMKRGTPVADQVLYSQMNTVANVTREDGSMNVYPMPLDDDNEFVCSVPIEEGETIRIVVHTEGANMYRDSQEVVFSRSAPAQPQFTVSVNPLPDHIVLKGLLPMLAKDELNLDAYFISSDSSASGLNFQVSVDDTSIVGASVKGNKLELKGAGIGTTTAEVIAADVNQKEYYGETKVQVVATFKNIIPLIIIGVGALVLLILLIFIIIYILTHGAKPMKGILNWSISTNGGASFGSEEPFMLEFSGKTERLGNITTANELMFMDLQNVVLTGKKDGLQIENKSKSCEMKDSFGAVKRSFLMKEGDECVIDCTGNDGSEASVSLRYALEEEYF